MATERLMRLFPEFDTCPGCEQHGMVPARTPVGLAFHCETCTRCWRVDMGWASEVDPRTGRHLSLSGRASA